MAATGKPVQNHGRRLLMKIWWMVLAALLPKMAMASEIWLQPEQFACTAEQNIGIGLKISDGKSVRDATLEPKRILRFELIKGDRHLPLTLREGEVPAASVPVPAGPSVLLVETEPKH